MISKLKNGHNSKFQMFFNTMALVPCLGCDISWMEDLCTWSCWMPKPDERENIHQDTIYNCFTKQDVPEIVLSMQP